MEHDPLYPPNSKQVFTRLSLMGEEIGDSSPPFGNFCLLSIFKVEIDSFICIFHIRVKLLDMYYNTMYFHKSFFGICQNDVKE